MATEERARRVTVFVGEADRWGHSNLTDAIVHMLHEEGCAGATVLRGSEGFGVHRAVHTASILQLSEDLPVVIMAVDTPERIDAVLPRLDEMVAQGGLVTVEDVTVRRP